MASSSIRQLAVGLEAAASILDDPDALDTGSVKSYISEQFVGGKGLIDPKSKHKKPSTQASHDQEEGSDQGGSGDEYIAGTDGDYDDEYDTSDDESCDEDDNYEDAIIVEWLNSNAVNNSIAAKHLPDPLVDVPGLRQGVEPFEHQKAGAAIIKDSLNSPSQGIIVGDPPGLGKTLQVLMPIAATREPGDGPCVVVCPTSCVSQWKEEVPKFFYESSMKTIVLTGEAVSPVELFKYDIVITSYSQVVSELVRARKFVKDMDDHVPGTNLPRRPALTLLSGIFSFSEKLMGKWLVLDEAQLIKNPKSRTFTAISVLRQYFQGCVMLSGTPLDNTWRDAFSLLKQLRNHPIFSPQTMSSAFVLPGRKKKHGDRPRGTHFVRFVKALETTTLRRPTDAIMDRLPTITTDVVQFVLPMKELFNSNEEYDKYLRYQHMSKKKDANMSDKAKADRKKAGFGALMAATHWANHPLLKEILRFEREARKADQPDRQLVLTEEQKEYLEAWRGRLAEDWNWRSPKVDIIVDTVNRHRDWRPGDSFVIMDESVFFLDIVEIALSNMFDPIKCFRYDGREHPGKRTIILNEFRATSGASVVLASRGTGGVGLNLQHANVLIQCGPWWKESWQQQAAGRIYRAGQQKDVFVYRIEAKGFGNGMFKHCKVEQFKKKKRDEKNTFNMKVLDSITHKDDEMPPETVCF